jgi:hypothetical protein
LVIQGTVLDLKLLQHDLWILQRTSKGHELFHANLERYSLSSEVILILLLQIKVYFVVLVCIFDFKTKSRGLGNLYIFLLSLILLQLALDWLPGNKTYTCAGYKRNLLQNSCCKDQVMNGMTFSLLLVLLLEFQW